MPFAVDKAGLERYIAVSRALGDALEHLGARAEYGVLCRSPGTLALLRLWDVDEDAAFAQFAALGPVLAICALSLSSRALGVASVPNQIAPSRYEPWRGRAENDTERMTELAIGDGGPRSSAGHLPRRQSRTPFQNV